MLSWLVAKKAPLKNIQSFNLKFIMMNLYQSLKQCDTSDNITRPNELQQETISTTTRDGGS